MSDLHADVCRALNAALGREVTILSTRALGGGSINVTERLDTSAGAFVLKSNPSAPARFFEAEAEGLNALRASGTMLTVPRVIACSSGTPRWIVLEYLGPDPSADARTSRTARRISTFEEDLGTGLAMLHRASNPAFGFSSSNFCGLTSQPNPSHTSWRTFYAEARLGHQLRLATESGHLTSADGQYLKRLIDRLPSWIDEPASGASLIHGDLWSGNLHVDANGAPALIDPAAYFAHREAEFGMMTLFGGFTPRVFAAYGEAFPLEPGWRDRNPLYQLYHLLNHLNLFGSAYHADVMNVVRRFV